MSNETRILREPEVLKRTGLSRSTLLRQRKRGQFPRAVKIGESAIGFASDEVDKWLEARLAEREVA